MSNASNRDFSLNIKARDQTGPGVRSATAAMNRLAVAAAAAKNVEFRKASAEVRQLQAAYTTAADAAEILGQEVRQAGLAASGAQVAAFQQSRRAALDAKRAYDAAGLSLARMRVTSFANAAGQRAGLRPHELQNLGYQVNDLFTQIASGTSPMQALAQQGGQIAQIFPNATAAILRFSPAIAAAGLVLGPFVASLARANVEAKNLGAMESLLRRSGDAALYSAPQLAEVAAQMIVAGANAEEARSAVERFTRDAVDPTYLAAFAKASGDMARVLRVDVKDAADDVTAAFTGNADAILSLDDRLNFLTRAERAHIEKLKVSKKEAEARTYAFDIFARRYGETAAKMAGPWTTILTNFDQAWRSFGDGLADAVDIEGLTSDLEGLLSLIARISAQLPGVNKNSRAFLAGEHARIDADIRRYQGRIAAGQGDVPIGSPFLGIGDAYSAIANLERERDVINRRIAAIDAATRPTAADTTRDPPKPAADARSRGLSEAQQAAKQQAAFIAGLNLENQARQFQNSLISKGAREAEILTAIEQARIDAAGVGLKLTDDQAATIRASVGDLYDARAAQAANEAIERARLELAQQRGEVESRAAYIARLTASEMADANAQTKADFAVILGQTWDIAEAARSREVAEAGLNDLFSLRRELQDQMAAAAERGDTGRVEELQARVFQLNGELQRAAAGFLAMMATATGPQAEALRAYLQGVIDDTASLGAKAVVTGADIDQMLSQGGADGFDQFAQSIAEGENAFDSLRDAFLSFAADFLRQIAVMIAQQAILNALGGGNGQPSSGGSSIAKMIAGLFHEGGVVGSSGRSRTTVPGLFANATRYHSGGIAGLAPNEVPAILLRNEEVLTEDDPRHRNNGGLASGGSKVKIVNVFDAADAFERGLGTERGEQVMLNFVRRNAGAFKAVLS